MATFDSVTDFNQVNAEVLMKFYGEFVAHNLVFGSQNSAMTFVINLSFYNASTSMTPKHIYVSAFTEHSGRCYLLIGGQLTKEENQEIRSNAKASQVTCESICAATEGSKVQKDFFLSAQNSSNDSVSTNPSKGSCYIATAIYGDYDAPQVLIFRNFRDTFLLKTRIGIGFVKLYYRYSPYLVDKLSHNYFLRKLIRIIILNPICKTLNFIQKQK